MIRSVAFNAALDAAGELVGVLRRHETGAHGLRPNFRGLG